MPPARRKNVASIRPPSVSFSELDAYRQCPHKWWLTYKDRWEPTAVSLPLERGQLWHEILAQHYRDGEVDPRLFRDDDDTQTESQALCDWLYPNYVRKYAEEDKMWKVLVVEQRVNHQIPGVPLRISGVIDLVVRENRRLWLVDHKTHKDMPNEKKLELDDQMPLYVWLLRKLGKNVAGVIYNVARTYRWKDSARRPDFQRFYLHYNDHQLETVVKEAHGTFKRMQTHEGLEDAERNTGDHCGWRCEYFESCLAGRKGIDEIEFMREKGFIQAKR